MINIRLMDFAGMGIFSICAVVLMLGCITLSLGLARADALPIPYVLLGTSLCSAAILASSLVLALTYTKRLLHSDLLPALDRMYQDMHALHLRLASYEAAAQIHSIVGNDEAIESFDEVLCVLDGRPCRIYRDGQVDLETLSGTRRFMSIDEARLFIGSSGPVRIERLL